MHTEHIATNAYVGEIFVRWVGGDARKPLHTFDTLFFTKLYGIKANGPYRFTEVQKWVSEKSVGFGIFRCKEWAIPINLNNIHWVLVRVSLPRTISGEFKVLYVDSGPQSAAGDKTAIGVTVRRKHKVLESFTLKSFINAQIAFWLRGCPTQTVP